MVSSVTHAVVVRISDLISTTVRIAGTADVLMGGWVTDTLVVADDLAFFLTEGASASLSIVVVLGVTHAGVVLNNRAYTRADRAASCLSIVVLRVITDTSIVADDRTITRAN